MVDNTFKVVYSEIQNYFGQNQRQSIFNGLHKLLLPLKKFYPTFRILEMYVFLGILHLYQLND